MRLTNAAVLLEGSAELGERFSLASERIREWSGKRNGGVVLSRLELSCDANGKQEYRRPAMEDAFAGNVRKLESNGTGERGAKVCFSSQHPLAPVVETTSRFM